MEGFNGEFLWELEIVEKQLIAMAEAVPPDRYGWRPEGQVRSVSEILVHVAAGNFMLLDVAGVPVPGDVYGELAAEGIARFKAIIRRNDELEKSVVVKEAVVAMLRRSLQAVRSAVESADATELDRRLRFFGETTSVRRVYLRLLAHAHEHMGQMIAYLRINGIAPPWPDWRPDRRG